MPWNSTVWIFLVLVLCQPGLTAQEQLGPEQLRQAIQELGADRFEVRERASLRLWQAGRAAEPELERALQSDDLEVRSRAREILNKFRFGLFPDSPREVAGWIRLYMSGNDQDRRDAWDGLRKLQATETTLFKLFDAESAGELRDWFARDLSVNEPSVVPWLLRQGKFQQAEQLLELGTSFDQYGAELRNYAAYLPLRNQLDFKIAQLRHDRADANEPAAGRDPNISKRLLACLMRANGDLQTAGVIAKEIGDRGLLFDVHYRLKNWTAIIDAGLVPGGNGVEKSGFTAAFHRLAGNADALERAVVEIKKPDEDRRGGDLFSAKALMINDRWQDAANVLGQQHVAQSFDLLCGLSRFREAFELVGMPVPPDDVSRWFAEHSTRPTKQPKNANADFLLALQVARTLYRLGETVHAMRLLEELEQSLHNNEHERWSWLIEAEFELELRDKAIPHAARAADRHLQATCQCLFREAAEPAQLWWQFLCRRSPQESRDATFSRVCRLVKRHADRPLEADELRRLVDDAERFSRSLPKQERTRWLQSIGETCLLYGELELARQLFMQQSELDTTADSVLRLGDLHAQQQAWLEAAVQYRRAAELDAKSALPLYLQGWALEQAGEEAEGRRLKELAVLLPLGNCEQRRHLAEGLAKHGLEEPAGRQYELICRIGPWHAWERAEAWAVDDACVRLASALGETNPLLAASYWERSLFSCLKTNKSYLHAADYAREVHRIHLLRALGLLQDGQTDRAVEEATLALAARPTSVEVVVECVPRLDKLELQARADALFDKVFTANEQVLQSFPRSAEHHHNLATLCVRTGRRIDMALAHARQATELDPAKAAHFATLAEIQFQTGDRDGAVRNARRCLQIEPQNKSYRLLLDRFEGKGSGECE